MLSRKVTLNSSKARTGHWQNPVSNYCKHFAGCIHLFFFSNHHILDIKFFFVDSCALVFFFPAHAGCGPVGGGER